MNTPRSGGWRGALPSLAIAALACCAAAPVGAAGDKDLLLSPTWSPEVEAAIAAARSSTAGAPTRGQAVVGESSGLSRGALCFDCSGANVVESEPNCGTPIDTLNGGCNYPGNLMSPIAIGDKICAGASAIGGTRDLDWYSFSVASTTTVTFTVNAEFPTLNFIAPADCNFAFYFNNFTGPCVPNQVTATLPAGNYVAIAAPDMFSGLPCNTPYSATLCFFGEDCGGIVDPCDEDTTAPVILDCPSSFTTTCNTEGGFNFDYTPSVEETCPYQVAQSWTNPLPFGENHLSVTVTDQAGNSDSCEFTITVVPDPKEPFRGFSDGQLDGWVREPDLVNMIEGPVNTKASTFDVGDDAANWGRRSILSFDTSSIPDDATITSARIRLTRSTVAGNTAPLDILLLDMGGPLIGSSPAVEPSDYDLAMAANLNVATSFPIPGGNGHTVFAEIGSPAFTSISRTGLTQFRVRFANESDDDNGADFISFYSGEAGSTVRPELIVEFYSESCSPCPSSTPCGGPVVVTLWSTPAEDGGLMESHYTSEVGGTANAGATTSPVGDMASRQQLQLLLNFDTSSIPVDATITSAELRVYRASATGSWASFGPIWVGMRNPCAMAWWYGASGALELADFQAFSSVAPVATLTVPSTNTYTSSLLSAAGLAAINRGGMTQMKLYYPTPDDGDAVADQVQIGTGNYGMVSPGRPRLVVTYEPGCLTRN